VARAIKEMDVRYPVAVDNDYVIWDAFANHHWPPLYFVDAAGRIPHPHYGEGEHEQSEMVLQMLMREAGVDVAHGLVRIEPLGVEAPAEWASLGSCESYLDYRRAGGFASHEAVVPDRTAAYSAPAGLLHNQWALSGDWRTGEVPIARDTPDGSISYHFQPRDVHLVMGPRWGVPSVSYTVRLDGEPPGPLTASTSTGTATAPSTTSGCTS
jgi:Thioredoxin like C-terminal domain